MTGADASERARVIRTLRDLIGFTDTAARLVARGRANYDSDEVLRLAAEAIMHKIGEAVARLPAEVIAEHPDVAWRSMKAARNVVAHDYEQMDYEILWNVLVDRMPAEAERIRAVLSPIDDTEQHGSRLQG
ncbi:MAG: DUF86 domain-containing protein [Microbacteriaceae bacterium]|nr:MAG: DUF86 domain-containing protein [Microbacteriaceae bacterium]